MCLLQSERVGSQDHWRYCCCLCGIDGEVGASAAIISIILIHPETRIPLFSTVSQAHRCSGFHTDLGFRLEVRFLARLARY